MLPIHRSHRCFHGLTRPEKSGLYGGELSHSLAVLSGFISRIVLRMLRYSRSCMLSVSPQVVWAYQFASSPSGCSNATLFNFVCLKMSMLLLTGGGSQSGLCLPSLHESSNTSSLKNSSFQHLVFEARDGALIVLRFQVRLLRAGRMTTRCRGPYYVSQAVALRWRSPLGPLWARLRLLGFRLGLGVS